MEKYINFAAKIKEKQFWLAFAEKFAQENKQSFLKQKLFKKYSVARNVHKVYFETVCRYTKVKFPRNFSILIYAGQRKLLLEKYLNFALEI